MTGARVLSWPMRRPVPAGALVLALTLAALLGLRRFCFDPNVAGFLPRGNETIELFLEQNAHAGSARDLYLVLRGEGVIARLDELGRSLTASPFLEQVAWTKLDFFGDDAQRARAAPLYYLPEETLTALESRLTGEERRGAIAESKEVLAGDPLAGRERVQRDPLGLRWILGDAGPVLPAAIDPGSPYVVLAGREVALLRVRGREEPFDVAYSRALLADIETRLQGVELELFGGYAAARSDARRIRTDLESSSLASIVAVLLFLTLSVRSLLLPHLMLAPVFLAIFWTLGFAGPLLGPLTPLAVGAAAILIGLGIDFPIHWLQRFGEERARGSAEEAVETTGRQLGRASIASLLTTVAAFQCFTTSSIAGLKSFGTLLTLGLVLSFLATFLVVPLLVRLVPLRREVPVSRVARTLGAFSRTVAGRRTAGALCLVALGGWLAVGARGLRFDVDPARLRPAEAELVQTAERLFGDLGFSPVAVRVLVPASVDLALVGEALDGLERAQLVAFHTGAHRSVPSARRRERVSRFRARTAGWRAGALADLAGAGFRTEPFEAGLLETERLLDGEPAPTEGEGRTSRAGREYWVAEGFPRGDPRDPATRARLHAALEAAFPVPVVILDPHGLSDLVAPILEQELWSASRLCGLAVLVLVFALLANLRLGLAALLPVATALGVTLGVLALAGIALHPGNLIGIPLVLGLGIDYGIHLALRTREGARDPLLTTGSAAWRTSATTLLGFGSLLTAQSPAIASLGLITSLGAGTAFLASMLLVPLVLRGRTRQADAP